MKWHHSPREKLTAVVLLSSKQTVPKYEGKPYWLWIELGFNSVFSIEMMMRLCAASTWENVLKGAYFVFDCAAVIPFWVEVVTKVVSPGAGGARAGLVQMLKALRMLRLLKLPRQYDGSIVIYRAMRVSMRSFFFIYQRLGCPFSSCLSQSLSLHLSSTTWKRKRPVRSVLGILMMRVMASLHSDQSLTRSGS